MYLKRTFSMCTVNFRNLYFNCITSSPRAKEINDQVQRSISAILKTINDERRRGKELEVELQYVDELKRLLELQEMMKELACVEYEKMYQNARDAAKTPKDTIGKDN